ncbi:hypothetical protein IGI04_025029 [Brassica rapa subsp. trilocularis]|uniref:Uncharacterized protein n=1 Tax=Brassica rapa subsp. trilocularis TaxID=1813537 RepID=A0ABQ7MAU0_BRACM|nr:hypothetical protein IGI04_025029 [Brassica rapa subsp. trilocularis]
MASLGLILFLSSVLLMSLCQLPTATEDDRKASHCCYIYVSLPYLTIYVYIAYMGAFPEKASYSPMSHHQNILQEVIELSSVEDSLVRSYGRSFNGFAAKLTESERDKLAGMEGVVSVFPDTLYKPLTTRSYEFMGLGDKSKRVPNIETDIIVGVIDHGIWPESKSFSDEGIGPIPKKWKGVCAGGTNFTCNTKVIGARYYVQDSARDNDSHGSHTASTAAGNIVEGVSMNGLAKGTARGGVPLGRIAIYRVCEPVGCNGASVLAAFDDAIADGVDVITISLGGVVLDLYVDPIAIGSFHAMTRGIVTTAAFGNAGPNLQTGQNVAPWIISVAAGYTDRKFVTTVVNGDAKAFPGKWINDFDLEGQMYPLAYGKTASNSCTEEQARLCASGCLNTVQGKIVVCDTLNNVTESREAGAVGTILYDFHIPAPDPIPLAVLDYSNFDAFTSYVLTSPDPRGTILRSKTVKDNDAPFVASFSSRGPNSLFSDIMKPDITAPGVNILAAYSPMSPTAVPGQSMDYYFMSGTSMACPHVGGVAAYIKTFHPDWSPSAVKSAIMTTAWPMNASKNAEAEFAYGSGHVNPTAAVNPGLVYEISKEDYLNMLCSLDYSANGISILAGGAFTCSEESKVNVRDLNYPSMTALYPSGSTEGVIFTRTVTNVGKDGSTYKAKLSGDPKLNIIVDPETLSFDSSGEKKSFNVTIPYNGLGHLDSYGHMSASLVWSDGSHNVRSMEGVVSVFPNTVYKLLTTRSYEFMGLGDKSKHVPEVETDIIVGVLDGGIWPESKSFSDEGIGPIPKKWKGICAGGTNFTCNKKLIGARHYVQDSARDKDSHGSHTASTAAGNIVEGVSMNGLAKGTARGGVPLGRIAIYRVCEPAGCNAASLLGAFDDAIADGVDVITISIGGGVVKVDVDPIAIGSFHAMTKGIVTTASSGNDGSKLGNARNVAPWIISVAAGYTDRKFVTTVVNGDAIALPGKSINDFDLEGQMYTLAYGKTASNNCTEEQARRCASGCLNTVQGKIVVCDTWNNVMESREAGAVGTILHINVVDIPGPDPIPVAVLNDTNYEAFRSYVLTSPNPRGTILRSKTVKDNDAPFVASFSSRGPNTLFSDIMKPDITAPGVNILAAYSPMSPTAVPGQRMDYYFMSGTSMACPHVGGVAAYIKTFHPDWSPSAVKSAIMTTAWPMNASKNAEAEFAYGSGHVNPTAAINPGLVYEISKEDYLNMLCSLDYSANGISILAGGAFTCSEESKVNVRDLNYPSMTAKVSASSSSDITFSRTVTNVGKDGSTYKAKLSGDPKLNIKVDPETLSFESSGDKKSFTVTVSGNSLAGISGIVSASLVWSDGSHNVRSPIVVYT